jgi:hypothetical protein
VQKFEFDEKKNEYSTAYFLKTNQLGGNITESLKARSTNTLQPLSYQFTELIGEKGRTIDAQFKGEMMTATVIDNGRRQSIQRKIPKGAFLSSFLAYVMLAGKEGMKTGAKYSYQAIAEEDGGLYNGEAYIAGEETVAGISAFKILNTFKDSKFVSFCTFKGDVIATRSPLQKISTELTASAREATEGLTLNTSTMASVFGKVPAGIENPVSRKALPATSPKPQGGTVAAPAPATSGSEAESETNTQGDKASPEKMKKLLATPVPTEENPKREGVPGGQGIYIKGQPKGK